MRWTLLVLALACTAMLLSTPGQSFLVAVFLDDLLDGLDLSRTAFSVIYALATLLSAAFSLLSGRASDRVGLRALWLVTGIGLGSACLLMSWASGIVLAAVALLGLRAFGHGPFPLLGTLLVNHRFRGRRGAAIAALSFAQASATIVLPPLVALLIEAVGWRSSYRILGIVVLALVPLALLVPGRRRALLSAAAALPEGPATLAAPRAGLRRLDLDRSAALLLVAFAATPAVATGLTFHAVSLLGGRGLERPAAAAALSAMGIAAAVVTALSAAIVDRLRTRTLLLTMSVALVASALLFLVPVGLVAYPAFALLGFNIGVFGIATGVAWARTYGLARIGRYQGISFFVISVCAAAGPLPLAVARAGTGSYTPGIVFLAAVAAVGVLAALRWHEPRVAA